MGRGWVYGFAVGPCYLKRAVAHGVMDKLFLDETLIQLMKEKDIFYIPTLALYYKTGNLLLINFV